MKTTEFDNLKRADLIVDAIYEGGGAANGIAGEPISTLIPGGGNMGGFRIAGKGPDKTFVVLFTTGEDKDWPDRIDLNTGRFTYYGDNKTPGHELHDTPKGGNSVLRRVFDHLHATPPHRNLIPPFFVFSKHPTARSARAVQFKGLAVPGYPGLSATEDLVAVWKTTKNQRFQNYRAEFTILDVPVVSRGWLDDVTAAKAASPNSSEPWKAWIETGKAVPLTAEPTTVIRTVEEQTPDTDTKRNILLEVWKHFEASPTAFEAFAARLFQMHDQRVVIDEITRGVVDGGRDAVGRYLLGLSNDPVYAEFSLEAKCYQPGVGEHKANTVGVKEVSRLISRIRHREFGVLVTTSAVARQAYEEVRADRHPIVFISGRDISEILIRNGYNSPSLVRDWLAVEFPLRG